MQEMWWEHGFHRLTVEVDEWNHTRDDEDKDGCSPDGHREGVEQLGVVDPLPARGDKDAELVVQYGGGEVYCLGPIGQYKVEVMV